MKNYRGRTREQKIQTLKILIAIIIIVIIASVLTYCHQEHNAADTTVWQQRWDKPATRTVATPEPTVAPEPTPEPTACITITDAERTLIATVCESEDNIHGMDGLTAVACTIRNRYEDGRFGDSIEDICTVSQFHGLLADITPSEDAYKAVDEVFYDGREDVTGGGLFFCTPTTDPDCIKKGLRETARVGGHVYYTDLEDKP